MGICGSVFTLESLLFPQCPGDAAGSQAAAGVVWSGPPLALSPTAALRPASL